MKRAESQSAGSRIRMIEIWGLQISGGDISSATWSTTSDVFPASPRERRSTIRRRVPAEIEGLYPDAPAWSRRRSIRDDSPNLRKDRAETLHAHCQTKRYRNNVCAPLHVHIDRTRRIRDAVHAWEGSARLVNGQFVVRQVWDAVEKNLKGTGKRIAKDKEREQLV